MHQPLWTFAGAGIWVTTAVMVLLAGCDRKTDAENDGLIDSPSLTEIHPEQEPPTVIFPNDLKTEDVVLNEFIRTALDACAKGDYDQFRELFGVTFQPPDQDRFTKLWQGIKQIKVVGVYAGQPQPPEYYVHVVVHLRRPDRTDRTERQAVVWIFREGDEWRMGPARSEITNRILRASTQPAEGDPSAEMTDDSSAASRPAALSASDAR